MKKSLLGLSLVLAAGSAIADNHGFDDRWYVTPSVSYVQPDSNRNASSGLALGIAFGKFIKHNLSLDLEFDNTTLDLNNGGELPHKSVTLMGRLYGSEKMGMRPFVGLGLGDLRYKIPHYGRKHDSTVNLAVGLGKKISDNINFRSELRYRLQNANPDVQGHDDFSDYLFNAGLSIAFGEAKTQDTTTNLVAQAPATDSDGDGVSDANDACPNTPAGTKVDSRGCAIVDGDDDRDGVLNSMDRCPNSVAGAVVDKNGCEVQVVIELQGVNFDFDKATLRPESIAILDAAVKTLGQHGKIHVEVGGHTDSKGSDAYNQNLSERRAKVVRDYLVSHGISSDRMTWNGYGESQPIADNATDEGRAKNRRTELKIK